ncbi:MAG TPA: hypothetical protein GXX17_04350 [Clostridiales bacterium]|nr:hypothetical protein [Clostridiales bacterium]
MKKIIFYTIFVLVFALALAACSGGTNQADTELLGPETAQGEDKTVKIENKVEIDGKIIQTAKSSMDSAVTYNDIATLFDKSEAVIRGVVENVEYFYVENFTIGLTKMDIKVLEVLDGNLNVGDKISAYKIGGYIPLKVAHPNIREKFPEMTDEEYNNTIIDCNLDGDPHPVVGQESVMFLRPGAESVPEGMYQITGNYKGEFILSGGTYKRHIDLEGKNINRKKLSDADKVFTYNEIKKEIQKCKSESAK